MADGSTVVGLFNRGREADKMTLNSSHIGVTGEAAIRDSWLKKDLGSFKEKFGVYVPSYGVVFVRVKHK